MNNNQFRRLVFDKPGQKTENGSPPEAGARKSRLGEKKSSFMPMTPRTVKGDADVDFARQVRERNAALQPTKKFKSSAPKGVKYGEGYTDRARERAEAEDGQEKDGKASRIKALEEQMKLGQISNEMFEALRDEITGGDISSTHLVKGLDRKLLERVRRGEDVLNSGGESKDAEASPDVDDELDRLEEKEVKALEREKTEKRGSMAPPPPIAGVKRSRDDIMAELKAQRKAAVEAKAAPAFDSRWTKVGEKGKSTTEIDRKGREVITIVDKDGNVKKKVRRIGQQTQMPEHNVLHVPDSSKPVLGSDAVMPEVKPLQDTPEEEDDIFEGVGTEYNPLGNQEDDDDSDSTSSDDSEKGDAPKQKGPKRRSTSKSPDRVSPSPQSQDTAPSQAPAAPRSYFKDTPSTAEESKNDRLAGVQDLLKKAAKMDPQASEDTNPDRGDDAGDHEARLKKRAQMLAQQDRDLVDMDMGFGGGRYDEGEDEDDGKKVKLSQWKDSGHGDDEGWQENGKVGGGKKKRKSKKRKGDVNNAEDIMRVVEARRAASGK